MNDRNPSVLRALLLLLLAAGPLQAQTMYACAMMDTVSYDACCCEVRHVDECENPECDAILASGEGPCCERTVEVTVDQEAGQDTLTAKLAQVRSGGDSPQPALVCSFDAIFPPPPSTTHGVVDRPPGIGQSGSDTWLVTQRLRI